MDCPFDTFPLLNGRKSMPSFLNEANLQAVKKTCIDNGRYYDLFTRLRTLFSPSLPSLNLTDEKLQVMAQKLHEGGSLYMTSKVPSKTPLPATSARLQSQLEIQRVHDILVEVLGVDLTGVRDVPDPLARVMDVTMTLVAEVCRCILFAGKCR
jgi:hypothetical protein